MSLGGQAPWGAPRLKAPTGNLSSFLEKTYQATTKRATEAKAEKSWAAARLATPTLAGPQRGM
ncbi:MAG: hypothetical protein GU356_08315 [Pyrobaculum sp.]|jgi:hypothetical protein|nr:hypothetical protein [Pyrobaculum sp.]